MRPIRLRMQAFGPYAKNVEIDFRKLGGAGIFLIHGQTGAGKTSVLDGICFALFGTSSGERKGDNLRSDFAKPDLKTEVLLEFALGREIYKIQREPSQSLKKKRGEGLKISGPEAQLFKLTSGLNDLDLEMAEQWSLLSAGAKKTDEEVSQLLGMSEDQFRQVVVLPQGQFRKFLAATSDAREKLLETLFRSEKYRKLAEFLDAKSRAVEQEIRVTRQNFAAHLQAFEVDDAEAFAERLKQTAVDLARLTEGASSLDSRFQVASERRALAVSAKRLRDESSALESRQTALRATAPYITSLIEKIERNNQVRPVLGFDSASSAIARDIAKLSQTKATEETSFASAVSLLEKSSSAIAALDARLPEIEELKAERESLREAWKSAEQLKIETAGFGDASAKLKMAEANLLLCEQALIATKQSAQAMSELILASQERAGRFDALKADERLKLSSLASLIRDTADLEKALTLVAQLEGAAQKAEVALHTAATNALSTKRDFHLSQAALIARELKAAHPCPVCGSLEHPQPASTGAEASAEAVEAAEKNQHAAAEALTKVRTQIDGARADLEVREARLGTQFQSKTNLLELSKAHLQSLNTELASLKTEIATLETSAKELAQSKIKFAALQAELPLAEKKLAATVSARDQLRTQVDSTQGKIAQLERTLPPERRDLEKLKSLGAVVSVKIKAYETERETSRASFESATRAESASRANLATLSTQLKDKMAEQESAQQMLNQALDTSGFATLEECRAAGLNPATLAEFENERRTFEKESAVVESRARELGEEFSKMPPWALELEARQAELASVETERTQSQALQMSLANQLKSLKAGEERLDLLAATIKNLEMRFQTAGRLAGVAAGTPPHNPSRVNFQRYVLAAQLDEVLEQASRRLHGMSRGQFQLRRASLQDDKRRSAGLELEVEDSLSGTSRPTASLSGGEGFIASLCLALALADVVQSQLGGVRLEAVFIDEGFGTLDPEALELAMKTLGELQAGGRMVGIISHVPELRDQIARRLIIRKTPMGSDAGWENSL